MFVFIRGAYMHHFDIGQFQARIRHPAHKEIVIFVHPKVFNRPRDERLPETLPDVFEYLNSVQWLNAHALLHYDEDTNEMVAAQPYTRDNFEHHALALTLQRKHQFLNRPLKCLLEHQAARIDFDKGGLFLVRPLPEEPCAEPEPVDRCQQAIAALDQFEQSVRWNAEQSHWRVEGAAQMPLARRIVPIVEQLASVEQLRSCLLGEDNEWNRLLLIALGGLDAFCKMICRASTHLSHLQQQRQFYEHLERNNSATTETSLMCEVGQRLPVALLRMLARHCEFEREPNNAHLSPVGQLLRADRFVITEPELSSAEQEFLAKAMAVLPTEYPQLQTPASWYKKVRDAYLLVLVTDTALRYGPLRWQGRVPKRWGQVGDNWVVSKPAAGQQQASAPLRC